MICKLEFVGVVGVFRAPARVPFSAAKKEPKRCRGGHGEDYDFAYAASRSPMMALPRTPVARASDDTFLKFVILWIMKDPCQDPFYFWTRALRPTWSKTGLNPKKCREYLILPK